MAFYYDTLEKEKVNALALELGRAGHAIRNYTQGFVALAHPEVLTLDNISGQIEGQCRAIRSALKVKAEIKPSIKNVYKAANFLQRILKEDFFKDSGVNKEKLGQMRALVDLMVINIRKIEREVNIAVLNQSASVFDDDLPVIPEVASEPATQEQLAQHFDADSVIKKIDAQGPLNFEEFRNVSFRLWSSMSNQAHSTQDVVSGYLNKKPIAESANKIVNQAGNIENAARAIISEITTSKDKLKAKVLSKQRENIIESMKTIKNVIGSAGNELNEQREAIIEILAWQKHALELHDQLIAANSSLVKTK